MPVAVLLTLSSKKILIFGLFPNCRYFPTER